MNRFRDMLVDAGTVIDPKVLFPQAENVYLELGTGRGRFIRQMAVENPGAGYIGVELLKEVLAQAVEATDAAGIGNCRYIWTRLQTVDGTFLPGSISGIYLNFSDPWPKERHRKRRLTHPDFLKQYKALLRPEGFIQVRTDNRQLFEFSLNSLLDSGFQVRKVRLDWHRHPDSHGAPRTEYEEKFSAAGKPIYQLEARIGV